MIFCSVPSVAEMNDERSWRTHVTNNWLKGLVPSVSFGFSDNGAIFIASGLFESGRLCLSDEDSRPELVGLIERTLK